MQNLERLRDRLKADRNPGHEIATFLLGHSNSIDYLIGHLEAAIEALKADQARLLIRRNHEKGSS